MKRHTKEEITGYSRTLRSLFASQFRVEDKITVITTAQKLSVWRWRLISIRAVEKSNFYSNLLPIK